MSDYIQRKPPQFQMLFTDWCDYKEALTLSGLDAKSFEQALNDGYMAESHSTLDKPLNKKVYAVESINWLHEGKAVREEDTPRSRAEAQNRAEKEEQAFKAREKKIKANRDIIRLFNLEKELKQLQNGQY